MTYGYFKDLTRRIASNRILRSESFDIAKNPKYDVYQRGSWYGWYVINKQINKGILILLCVIHIFSKYAWVVPLKDKKGITITDVFQKILD